MNAEQLQDAIGKIDDKYIAEAEHFDSDYSNRKVIFILSSVSAAAVAMCICVNYFTSLDNKHQFETENIYTVTSVTKNSENEEIVTDYNTESEVSTAINTLVSSEKTDITENVISGETKDLTSTEITSFEKDDPVTTDTGITSVKTDDTSIQTDIINTDFVTTPHSSGESKQSISETDISTSCYESECTGPDTAVPSDYPLTNIPPTAIPSDDTTKISEITSIETTAFISAVPPENITLYSFPAFLNYADNKTLNRRGIISKDQIGEFIQKTKFTGPIDSEYILDEYAAKSISSGIIRVMYFEKADTYVAYMNRDYQAVTLGQLMRESGMDKLKIKSEKYTLSDSDEKEISAILSDPENTALMTSSYSKSGNSDVFTVDYEYISGISIRITLTERNIVVIKFLTQEYAYNIGETKGNKVREILSEYQ